MNGQYQPRMHRSRQAGFTLVELLVVIAIIAILVGLISVAAVMALNAAKDARIKTELDQLSMAMEAFKAKYGAYPPCDLRIAQGTITANDAQHPNQLALINFMTQAFPRYNTANLYSDLTGTTNGNVNLSTSSTIPFAPDRALVFWLSGLSPDVTSPIAGQGARTPFFNFDQTRLYDVVNGTAGNSGIAGHLVYSPAGCNVPYVYFDNGTYGNIGTAASPGTVAQSSLPSLGNPAQYQATSTANSSAGFASPYVLDVNNTSVFNAGIDTFCNPTTFQIISAGQDNQFGNFPNNNQFRLYPAGVGYDPAGYENDNVTNFNAKGTLGNALAN